MFKIDNVIILAAGRGSRMLDLCDETPKPLLEINKKCIIEKIIENFIKRNFCNITIVVGYLKEKFYYLKEKYNIKILENDDWLKYNNISSINSVKDELGNTLIINADVIIDNNYVIPLEYEYPVTFAEFNENLNEWSIDVDDKNNIIKFNTKPIKFKGYFQREITVINKKISNLIRKQINDFDWNLHYEHLVLEICKKNNISFKIFPVDKFSIYDIDNKHEYLKIVGKYDKNSL